MHEWFEQVSREEYKIRLKGLLAELSQAKLEVLPCAGQALAAYESSLFSLEAEILALEAVIGEEG